MYLNRDLSCRQAVTSLGDMGAPSARFVVTSWTEPKAGVNKR
jgi:hypothetical protein